MNPLLKFPFKAMLSIVQTFPNNGDEIGLFKLQRGSRSCLADTAEVIEMIMYLTHFGQIEQISQFEWIRNQSMSESEYNGKKPPRIRLLRDILAIIKSLSLEPKTKEQICESAHISIEKVELYLIFLAKLTNKGMIKVRGNRFNEKWFVDGYKQHLIS